jgi:hypothetical protein
VDDYAWSAQAGSDAEYYLLEVGQTVLEADCYEHPEQLVWRFETE